MTGKDRPVHLSTQDSPMVDTDDHPDPELPPPGTVIPLRDALVLLYCKGQPHRAGQVHFIERDEGPGFWVFGRHAGSPPRAGRITFLEQRPGREQNHGELDPLLCMKISRQQLRLKWKAPGVVSLKNLHPERPLYVNGREVEEQDVSHGDLIQIGNQVVLTVLRRPFWLLPLSQRSAGEHPTLKGGFGRPCPLGLIGESPALWELRREVLRTAASDEPVLLQGRSGSGKGKIAAALHRAGPRPDAPFVGVNLPLLTETVFELELCGREKDAVNRGEPYAEGYLRRAGQGTIFLDEVGELAHSNQSRLLKIIEERVFEPLGAHAPVPLKARVVAATNRSGSELKHDLLYRFVRRIHVPSLADRREDIPLLAAWYAAEAVRKDPEWAGAAVSPEGVPPLSAALILALMVHPLAGEVRDVERLVKASVQEGGPPLVTPCAELRDRWEAWISERSPGLRQPELLDPGLRHRLATQRRAAYRPTALPVDYKRSTAYVDLRRAIAVCLAARGWDCREALTLVAGAPSPTDDGWRLDPALRELRDIAEQLLLLSEKKIAEAPGATLEARRESLTKTWSGGASDLAHLVQAVEQGRIVGREWLTSP